MRAEMEAELPFHFISEKVPMCDKSGHVILCAMVAVPDLMGLVLHYIDEYDRTDQLICHDGAIPDGTIVVKIGGDHGGGTLKNGIPDCQPPAHALIAKHDTFSCA